jgi:hypothetical protein
LISLRFYFELACGGDETGDSMLLPYMHEPELNDYVDESGEISVGV